MVVVGKILFVHGGVEDWVARVTPEAVNTMVNRWMKFFLGLDKQSSLTNAWSIGPKGPLWTRALARFTVDQKDFGEWLRAAGLDRVVVAHTVTHDHLPALRTEFYGDKLIMIDTAISNALGGNLSAVEWSAKEGYIPRAHIFARPKSAHRAFRPQDGIDYIPLTFNPFR
jgi:hypothetical protein